MQFPDWFTPKVGFLFCDEDGDLCVYLGFAGYRDLDSEHNLHIAVHSNPEISGTYYQLVFHPAQHLYANLYKKEWFLKAFRQEDMAKIQPFTGRDTDYVVAGEIPKYRSGQKE